MYLYYAVLVVVLVLYYSVKIIRPVEKGVVETLGKFTKTAEAGIQFLIPFVQRIYKINITEQRVDIEPQSIITKDKLNAEVDGVVYYKVVDPKNAIYNVNHFASAVPSLAKTTLRAVIGKMTLTESNENRDKINTEVENILDKQTDPWGITVIRVELQRIEPPADVQSAMNNVVKAENEKIAALDIATAKETTADGDRRAEIKKAEGHAQAIRLSANAEADAIKAVNESAEKYFKGNAQLLKRLETVAVALKNNSKIVVPANSDLVNVIGDMAGGVLPIVRRDPG
ncbi:MAG: SPFH/Band 7/PHB domain protein [Candidatus Saganbacteria bacterium]|nr:SPFH/Band 7/PHB domain protein [Candidatus Saganbacteria bacterium]